MGKMFKIRKKEFYKRRPDWLTGLLLNFKTSFYDSCTSHAKAVEKLDQLQRFMEDSKCLEGLPKIRIDRTHDKLRVVSVNNTPYITFSIVEY